MRTADWALVISLCSFGVSLAAFVWNVWSKFIYPKPQVQVAFRMMTIVQGGSADESILSLSATNMGPIEVTLYNALVVFPAGRFRLRSDRYGLLNPLHNYPTQTNPVIGPFGGGLPKKLEVGEQFTVHLVPDHEFLAKGNYQRIGFTDTFGRSHWASRRVIGWASLPACEQSINCGLAIFIRVPDHPKHFKVVTSDTDLASSLDRRFSIFIRFSPYVARQPTHRDHASIFRRVEGRYAALDFLGRHLPTTLHRPKENYPPIRRRYRFQFRQSGLDAHSIVSVL
jgi:hypothetical protein